MRRYLEAVTLFYERQKLGINTVWTPDLEVLRRHLIHEELGELELAFYRHDSEKLFDAVGDLLYVIAGLAVQFGYQVPATTPNWYNATARTDGWSAVTMLGLSRTLSSHMHGDFISQYDMQHMLGAVITFGQRMSLPYDEIFDRVQAANMTKQPRGEGDERVSNKGASFVPPTYADLVEKWDK